MRKPKELEEELFHIGLYFLAVGAGVWMLYSLVLCNFLPEIPCLFDRLAGIYCPGCGGTRAFKALLQGHFLLSIWYHPLILYMVTVGGGFMLTQGMHRIGIKRVKGWKFHNWYLYVAIIILCGNFLIKNLLRLIWGITL